MEELAVTLDESKEYAEAEGLYRKVVGMQERVLGPDHPVTAASKYNWACNATLQGQRDRAIAILRDAIAHGLIQAQIDGIAQDEDFKSLHGDPRLEALIAKTNSKLPPSQ